MGLSRGCRRPLPPDSGRICSRRGTLNVNIGRAVTLGSQPRKLSVELNNDVGKSGAFANEWMRGVNVTPGVKSYSASVVGDILR